MPLNPNTLRDGLRKHIDPAYNGYVGFPADAAAVGAAWGEALRSYFDGIAVPPGILPAQQLAGEQAFSAIFQPTAAAPTALALLNAGLTAYVLNLVAATGVTTPPIGSPVIALVNTNDANVAATAIATAIDTWARTGTFTPAAPPGAPPVPWS